MCSYLHVTCCSWYNINVFKISMYAQCTMYVHFCEFTFISALHDYSTIMHKTDPFWPTNSNRGINNGFKAKATRRQAVILLCLLELLYFTESNKQPRFNIIDLLLNFIIPVKAQEGAQLEWVNKKLKTYFQSMHVKCPHRRMLFF